MHRFLLPLFALVFGLGEVCAQTFSQSNSSGSGCSGTFTDSNPVFGVGGQYAANENSTFTLCPSTAGQCVRVGFTNYNTEEDIDTLEIFMGSTATGTPLAVMSGNLNTVDHVFTADNLSSGCLTFRFHSNGSVQRRGWLSTVSCVTCPPPLVIGTPLDCNTSAGICSNTPVTTNSNGFGVQELGTGIGCFSAGEHQSTWLHVRIGTAGTFAFDILPFAASEDYDFIVFGPTTGCGTLGAPTRCSWAASGCGQCPSTGLGRGAADVSEGAGGNGFVSSINANAGDEFWIVVDNFLSSNRGFTINWTGTAALDCSVLPVKIENLHANVQTRGNELVWESFGELSLAQFEVLRRTSGGEWQPLGTLPASGKPQYAMWDYAPAQHTEYMLNAWDVEGGRSFSNIIEVVRPDDLNSLEVSPNPAQGVLHITAQAHASQCVVNTVLGQKVLTCNLLGGVADVDVQHLSPGIYLVQIYTPAGALVGTRRVAIQ